MFDELMLAQRSPEFVQSVPQILRAYAPVFLVALVVSLAATPVFAWVARTLGVVDRPSGRKIHRREVPYLGGLAMLLSWLVAVVVGARLHLTALPGMTGPILGIVIGAVVATVVGLLDDLLDLPPLLKLAGQLAAGFILLGVGRVGMGIMVTSLPFGLDVGPQVLRFASISLSLFVVLGMCNAANLMDGLDGLCSGVILIIVSTLMVVSLLLTMTRSDIVYDPTRMIISLALLGAVVGFVPYNFNPASIFMGDAGSMLLGFNAAVLCLLLGERVPTQRFFWAALVVFGLPAFDTLVAMIRRMGAGKNPFRPDAYHLHHQLIRQGLTVRQAVSILYLLAMLFSVAGLLMIWIRLRYSLILLAAIGFNLLLLTTSFGLHKGAGPARLNDDSVSRLAGTPDAELSGDGRGDQKQRPTED